MLLISWLLWTKIGWQYDLMQLEPALQSWLLFSVLHTNVSPSFVGLIISSLLQIVAMMSLVAREMVTVENNMNAVKHIHHYADKLHLEADFHIPGTAPPTSWPSKGRINFNHVFMSYQVFQLFSKIPIFQLKNVKKLIFVVVQVLARVSLWTCFIIWTNWPLAALKLTV